jgi:hypothetical protein
MMRPTLFLRSHYAKPPLTETRHFYELISEFGKKTPENYFGTYKTWTKPEIDEAVLNLLFDYAQAPEEKVHYKILSV